jgi:SAM-dependent methyltransferase
LTDPYTEQTRRLAAFYSAGAGVYERLWGPALAPLGTELIEGMPIVRSKRILDAGTGAGLLAPALIRRAPEARVIGVDIAVGMLRRASRKFPVAAMDLAALAFADEFFDAIVTSFVLFHLPEPTSAIAELRRVLRPGGVFGLTVWAGEPDFEAHRIWTEELDRSGAAPAPKTADHERFGSAAKLEEILESAGFSTTKIWERPFGHSYESEEFLEIRTNLGGSRGRFLSLSVERREALLERVRSRLSGLPASAFHDPTTIIFAVATRD